MTESETAKIIFDTLRELRTNETEAGAAFVAMRLFARAKRDAVAHGLTIGPVLVDLDPRQHGVAAPEEFRECITLALRFGHNLTPAIHDLELNDEHLAGTLSFDGKPCRCVIPWRAVWAASVDGGAHLGTWKDSIPVELRKRDPAPPAPTAEKPRPRLSLVPATGDS